MNPFISLLNKVRTALSPSAQPNSPASLAEGGGGKGAGGGLGTQPQRSKGGSQPNSPALNSTTAIKLAKYLIPAAVFILLLIWLSSCKSPATLTNNESHHARDSTYHATVHRIETHDTIIFGAPSIQYPSPILRISDRTITLHDTVYICRTDTLIRTQTITEKERYIPPFYRFCTITFATFATFATLAFSIHLLLRCKLPRLSCKEGRG